MLDIAGEVLYVGKAKNLKKRVSSYFMTRQDRDIKTIVLVSKIASIQTIITRTESEALILERQLIQSLQPRYNIQLKDDKNYPYIKITEEPFPKIMIVRYKQRDRARYFGPYPSIGSTKYLQRLLYDLFPLRDCKQDISLDKPEPKCLKLDLQKCLGPCVLKHIKPDYDDVVGQLSRFLEGKQKELLTDLKSAMTAYSNSYKFEKAAVIRDRIKKLEQLFERQLVQLGPTDTLYVWAHAENDTFYYALVQTYIEGKLLYQNGFYLEKQSLSPSEFFDQALIHFFDPKNPAFFWPKKMICSEPFYAKLSDLNLETDDHKKIHILSPQKGDYRQVLESALKNAHLSLSRLESQTLKKQDPMDAVLLLQKELQLSTLPRRILGIDISHFQASHIVGSVVYFKDGIPYKDGYRRFKIKTVSETSHDPLSIFEVVFRRLKPMVENKEVWPDLILIDGGKGQLRFAVEAAAQHGIFDLPFISLAKKEELIYFPNQQKPLQLSHQHLGLRLLQYVRNEAHRFALTFQRSQRQKDFESALSKVEGLGKSRINELYKQFGTLNVMAHSDLEAVSKVGKMGKVIAQKVIEEAKKLVILIVAFGFFLSAVSHAEEPEKAEELNKLRSKIEKNKSKIKQKQAEKKVAEQELGQLSQQLRITEVKLKSTQNNLKETKKKAEKTQTELVQTKQEYGFKSERFSNRLVDIYKNKNMGAIEFLFSPSNLLSVVDASYYFDKLINNDVDMITDIKKNYRSLEHQTKKLETQKKSLSVLNQEIEMRESLLSQKKQQQQQYIQSLHSEIAEMERMNKDLEKASQEITSRILRLGKATNYLGTGHFARPVEGWLSSLFGYRLHPIFKRRIFHSGVDFAAPQGKPIYAADTGVVIVAGEHPQYYGYGKITIIDHGRKNGKRLATVYAHQSQILVREGETVKQGQEIGKVGRTGHATGPHLHFEVRVDGIATNPLEYLKL